MDKFALNAIEELYKLCTRIEIPDFVSPVNAHALLFELYFFVFRVVWPVLQAVSASQMEF